MKYLLDTHALIWFTMGSNLIPDNVMKIIEDDDNDITFSMASILEIAIKAGLGKLDSVVSAKAIHSHLTEMKFQMVMIMPEHAVVVQNLSMHHRDPFDRMLIAQAMVDGYTLVSKDDFFRGYDVPCIW